MDRALDPGRRRPARAEWRDRPTEAASVHPGVGAALALQRSAGNAATAQLVTRSGLSNARRPDSMVLSRSAGVDEQASAEHLVDTAGTLTGPWSGLDWATVAKSARDRTHNPQQINQGPLGLCGPAAVLNWMAETEPGTFVYDVWTVFEEGAWGGKRLNSTLLANSAMAGMDQLDWMMLSAMQDNANDVLDYYGRQTKWRDGETLGDLKHTMLSWTKIQDISHFSCVHWGTAEETEKVNDLLNQYGDDICVVVEVDSTTLQNQSARGSNDHYVRLRAPVSYGDTVNFDIFTWGRNRSMSFKQDNFNHMVDGYIVGARRSGIL